MPAAHEHAHERHEHVGHSHESAPTSPSPHDAFPRHATVDEVARALGRRERLERAQVLLLALGLTLVALALPTQALFGQSVALVDATARGVGLDALHLIPCALARALVATTGVDAERAWFALSALAFGLTLVPLVRIARAREWEHGPALAAALLVLCAPVVLVAGTVPDASAFRLLGAAFFCSELVRRPRAGDHAGLAALRESGPHRRAFAWFVASLFHVGNAWTWPALLAAELRKPGPGETARRGRVEALAAATLAFVLVFALAHRDVGRALHAAQRALLAGGSGGPGPIVAWTTLWLPALGAAGVGLAAWLAGVARGGWKREPELALLALVPWAAQTVGGAVDWELPWVELAPLGLLGLLALAQRMEERPHAPKLGLAALALALYGLAGATWLRSLDRHAAWTERASELLNPGDVVLTASGEHRHLLEHRFHVATVDLRPIGARPAVEREAFWKDQRDAAERLAAEGRRLVLDLDSLADFGTVAWPDAGELERFVADARPVVLPDERLGTTLARGGAGGR
ncbi:MAG: hypothetical protein IPJ77_22835 [Planctomycetes bacterium]|nr:hypothetical protein [Planctomycetota bacterium]